MEFSQTEHEWKLGPAERLRLEGLQLSQNKVIALTYIQIHNYIHHSRGMKKWKK